MVQERRFGELTATSGNPYEVKAHGIKAWISFLSGSNLSNKILHGDLGPWVTKRMVFVLAQERDPRSTWGNSTEEQESYISGSSFASGQSLSLMAILESRDGYGNKDGPVLLIQGSGTVSK